jgi:hypothetical protein
MTGPSGSRTKWNMMLSGKVKGTSVTYRVRYRGESNVISRTLPYDLSPQTAQSRVRILRDSDHPFSSEADHSFSRDSDQRSPVKPISVLL